MRLTHACRLPSTSKRHVLTTPVLTTPAWQDGSRGRAVRPLVAHRRGLVTLAIESSCDDTCVAVLKKFPSGAARLLFHKKVTSDHRSFGGVHPAVAVVGHTQALAPVLQEAIDGLFRDTRPDFVTVTRGPGMTANLATGLNTAKGLALAWGVPLLAVNHMQAHALTPRLVAALDAHRPGSSARAGLLQGRDGDDDGVPHPDNTTTTPIQATPEFPFLSLLVSGGHTMLVLSASTTDHRVLAPNLSGLAVGDMLDKAARLLVPPALLAAQPDTNYAAALESFVFPGGYDHDHDHGYGYLAPATRADEIAPLQVRLLPAAGGRLVATLTPPLHATRRLAYDFAGLGTQIAAAARDAGLAPGSQLPAEGQEDIDTQTRRALGHATMRLAFEHLASRVILALNADSDSTLDGPTREAVSGTRTLVVSGGVARNRFLGTVLRAGLEARGFGGGRVRVVTPPPPLCVDNAAMIAWAGVEMWEAGWRSELDVLPLRRWPVDAREEGGILGVGGWVRR